ncbi:hypothetical protein ACJMK2_039234 [Sinanodonta woodiana]|uniref:UMOD/GP2/OIT3-like D8C domain-containing protein n=1 Tax=Sinanodonta woodiana TaxID=1069815 RepID=A0ABD3WCV5_SINWO
MDIYISVCLTVLLLALCPAFKATLDPCIPGAHKELHRGKYRGTLCPYNFDKPVCDKQIEEGWYKVQGLNGPLKMPDSFSKLDVCGTNLPIWLNGSHPTEDDGTVHREGCIPTATSSCFKVVNITIKLCPGFFVYYLTPTSSCPIAYCFGADEECPPFDPCDYEYEHSVIENENGDRSSMCTTDGDPYCDDKIENGWYAIHSSNGYQRISSNCPNYSSCKTKSPIWINGSIPTIQDDIVTNKACVRDDRSCCSHMFDVEMKNCSSYVVYKLSTVPCFQRYCTDDKTECPIANISSSGNSTENGVTSKYYQGMFIFLVESIMLLVQYIYQRN